MKNMTKKERSHKKIKQSYVENVRGNSKKKSNSVAVLLVNFDQNLNNDQSYVVHFSDGRIYNGEFHANQEGNVITFLNQGIYKFDIIGEILDSNLTPATLKIESFPKELDMLTEYEFNQNLNFSTVLEVESNQRINLRIIKSEVDYVIRKGFRMIITEI